MREVDEEGYAIRPNKSAQKREQAAVRRLVEELLNCTGHDWAAMGLEERLQRELRLARGMKASGARNRQVKFIARLLQEGGLEEVRHWLEERERRQAEERYRFHRLEQWRDRLVEEGDGALGDYLAEHPHTDRQQLRQLIRAARRERDGGKPTGASKKLFRLLRENTDE